MCAPSGRTQIDVEDVPLEFVMTGILSENEEGFWAPFISLKCNS